MALEQICGLNLHQHIDGFPDKSLQSMNISLLNDDPLQDSKFTLPPVAEVCMSLITSYFLALRVIMYMTVQSHCVLA